MNEPDPPEIKIRDVKFEGATKLPFSEQNLIASEIMALEDVDSKNWLDDVKERVREAWQQHGFFKVEVEAESHELGGDTESKEFAISFHLNEGPQYRLGAIHFLRGTQYTPEQMRALFPISEGDIFNTYKIGEGLEALRKLYGGAGFINFTAVPDTAIDEQNARVSLNVDIEEGKQFHISQVKVIGRNDREAGGLLRQHNLESGAVFDQRNVEVFARDLNLPPDEYIFRRIDEKTGTVTLCIDATPAP